MIRRTRAGSAFAWILVALFLVAGAPFGSLGELLHAQDSPTNTRAEREAVLLLNTAGRLYRQKNWKDAAATYGDFLKRFPAHAEAADARFARGYCLHQEARHVEAIEEFRVAARKQEASWIGEAYFYLGRSLEALARARPEDSEERKDRLLAAAQSYQEAVGRPRHRDDETIDSEFVSLALVAQGEVLYGAGAHGQVVTALERLMQDSELNATPTFARGLYTLALSQFELAEAARPAAGAESADHTRTLAVLARISDLVSNADPLWLESTYLRARLLHQRAEWSAAAAQYAEAAARQGNYVAEATYYQALALYEGAGVESLSAERRAQGLLESEQVFSAFLRLFPKHQFVARAHFYAGLCDFEQGRYGQAEENFRVVALAEGELFGLAWLRLGQCLLLKEPALPAAAAEALEKAVTGLRKASPVLPGEGSREQLAEAIYWRGEALLTPSVDLPADARERAAEVFAVVASEYSDIPDLAEKALYQEARALFLASKRREAADAARRYRERYPRTTGRFYAETLQLSAENALLAEEGELDEPERGRAAVYYAEAATLLKEGVEARRLQYLAGVASYSSGDYANAESTLELVHSATEDKPLPGFDEPELSFFLADALAQNAHSVFGDDVPARAERDRLEKAVGLFMDYLLRGDAGAHRDTAMVNLGLCQKWLGLHADAKTAFREFVEAYPQHASTAQVEFELANACLTLGELPSAAEAYLSSAGRAATRQDRGGLAAQALLQAAKIQRLLGKPQAALDALKSLNELGSLDDTSLQGVRLAKLRTDADFERASALLEAGSKENAKVAFAEHLARFQASSHQGGVRLQLAQLHMEDGEHGDALTVLKPLTSERQAEAGQDQALYLSAWSLGALAEKAEGADTKRLRSEMEAVYRRLIVEHPRSDLTVDARLELGQHLFNRKAYAEARNYFEQMVASVDLENGGDRARDLAARSWYSIGFVAFEENKHREAREAFDKVIAAGIPELLPRALFQGARSWMLSGGEGEAVIRFGRLVNEHEAGEQTEEALLRMGECQHRLGQYEEARRTLERMLKEYPKGRLVHEGRFALGFALQFLERFEDAIEQFRVIVTGTQLPVAARAQYHIGECFVDSGSPRGAAREFLTVASNFDFDGDGENIEKYRVWVRRSLLAAGVSFDAAGQRDAAVAQYKDLVTRYPESDEGKAARVRLEEKP